MKIGMDGTKRKKNPTPPCWGTKIAYTLKNASIGQVVMARNYAYSGSICTTPSITDRWYHYDHIGNVVTLTDEASQVTDFYDMDAFGTVKSGDKSGLHLTTKEYDEALDERKRPGPDKGFGARLSAAQSSEIGRAMNDENGDWINQVD